MSSFYYYGDICSTNDKYKIDYGVRGPTHARYARLPKPSTLEARLSLFRYAQSRTVSSCLMLFGPPIDTLGRTPIPVFTRSSPFAHFTMLNREESALARCRAFTPIDLYHIITMHIRSQCNHIIQKIA